METLWTIYETLDDKGLSWCEVCTVAADTEGEARTKAGKHLNRESDLKTGFFRAEKISSSQHEEQIKLQQQEYDRLMRKKEIVR